MDNVIEVSEIVQREVADYARGKWHAARAFPISDTDNHIYTVIAVPDYPRKRVAGVIVMARVVGETVIIEQDITDKPLVEELVRAGVPRGQIVLTYAGEPPPDLENI